MIAEWDSDFKGIQREVESINTIARGKAVHAPMQMGDDASSRKGSSVTGLNLRNGFAARKASSQNNTSFPSFLGDRPGTSRIPSSSGLSSDHSRPPGSHREYDEPEPVRDYSPGYASAPSHSPAGPVRDYFHSSEPRSDSNTLSVIAAKKKPPPPPQKRIQSSKEQWVTALYTFTGQEGGDLSFQEGDRIRVVKRTDSTDDWWDGELRGVRGKFPGNYVE